MLTLTEKACLELDYIESELRAIAAKPRIGKVVREFGMSDDPLAEANSLLEHFLYLLESRVVPDLVLRRLASPEWFRYSLELRRSGASQAEICWALTGEGSLYMRGSSPYYGRVISWMINLFRRHRRPPSSRFKSGALKR
jgi:hypothetical protein